MVTVDTELKVFQYKVLHNTLFVNKTLFKLGKDESSLCSFCKPEDGTYIPLLYRCRKISLLWGQLQELFSTGLGLHSTFPQSAIFALLDDALER